jgi:hypothetical protein
MRASQHAADVFHDRADCHQSSIESMAGGFGTDFFGSGVFHR